jgi:DNA-directed RNA polymerase specialized sigma24 family protein
MWRRAVTQHSGLSIAALARRCAEAMSRFQRRKTHDSSSCYELFRHALQKRDQEAWSALYGQYHRLVRSWLGSPPGNSGYLVNQVFRKFWQAIPAEQFDDFPTLGALLAYLKRCAKSVAADDIRREERQTRVRKGVARALELTTASNSSEEHVRERVLERVAQEHLHEQILSRLRGHKERLVFYDSYELGLRPREIAERWPDLFADAKEVSRVKERILRRLRRDAQLRAIWETLFPSAEKPRYGRSMV